MTASIELTTCFDEISSPTEFEAAGEVATDEFGECQYVDNYLPAESELLLNPAQTSEGVDLYFAISAALVFGGSYIATRARVAKNQYLHVLNRFEIFCEQNLATPQEITQYKAMIHGAWASLSQAGFGFFKRIEWIIVFIEQLQPFLKQLKELGVFVHPSQTRQFIIDAVLRSAIVGDKVQFLTDYFLLFTGESGLLARLKMSSMSQTHKSELLYHYTVALKHDMRFTHWTKHISLLIAEIDQLKPETRNLFFNELKRSPTFLIDSIRFYVTHDLQFKRAGQWVGLIESLLHFQSVDFNQNLKLRALILNKISSSDVASITQILIEPPNFSWNNLVEIALEQKNPTSTETPQSSSVAKPHRAATSYYHTMPAAIKSGGLISAPLIVGETVLYNLDWSEASKDEVRDSVFKLSLGAMFLQNVATIAPAFVFAVPSSFLGWQVTDLATQPLNLSAERQQFANSIGSIAGMGLGTVAGEQMMREVFPTYYKIGADFSLALRQYLVLFANRIGSMFTPLLILNIPESHNLTSPSDADTLIN